MNRRQARRRTSPLVFVIPLTLESLCCMCNHLPYNCVDNSCITNQKEPTMSTAVATGIAAGTWTVDPSHANVGFVARHLMVHKVRGLFSGVAGAIHVGETLDD